MKFLAEDDTIDLPKADWKLSSWKVAKRERLCSYAWREVMV